MLTVCKSGREGGGDTWDTNGEVGLEPKFYEVLV